jgi:hypothetical protein
MCPDVSGQQRIVIVMMRRRRRRVRRFSRWPDLRGTEIPCPIRNSAENSGNGQRIGDTGILTPPRRGSRRATRPGNGRRSGPRDRKPPVTPRHPDRCRTSRRLPPEPSHQKRGTDRPTLAYDQARSVYQKCSKVTVSYLYDISWVRQAVISPPHTATAALRLVAIRPQRRHCPARRVSRDPVSFAKDPVNG